MASAEHKDAAGAQPSGPSLGGLGGFLRLVARFTRFALPYWDKLLLRVVYRFANSIILVLGVLATSRMVDDGLLARDLKLFLFWAVLKAAISAHILVFITVQANVSNFVMLRLNLRFKRMMFNHVQRMAMAFHQKRPVGENMYRVNRDTEMATDLSTNAVPETLEWTIELLTMLTLALVMNPAVVACIAAYLVVLFAFSHLAVGQIYKAQHLWFRAEQRVSAILQESFGAFSISKTFARERHDRRRYFGRLKDVIRGRLRNWAFISIWMEGRELLQAVLVTGVTHTLLCGWFVVQGRMTIGVFVATAEMMGLLISPVVVLIATIQRMRVSAVPAQRMLETLDWDPPVKDKPDARPLGGGRGEIRFENVCFRYTPDGPDVIRDLSFTVAPGGKVALVGVSGAGKTSIFNLLMRFCDPTSGRVLIDGHDLRDLKLRSYLEKVSVVLQENFLFSATIRDNILVGYPDADQAAFDEAVRRSGLADTIRAQPDGLDTMLLEGGNLSMGQKQRIGIARAVIRNPRFLFLDEATSSLDPATEAEILEQLKEVERGRTVLVIAHHIESVRQADEILVMEKGRLVQRGRHGELMGVEGGAYRRLWSAERAKLEGLATGEAEDEAC